jgi:toxin-antitoxin system PIN domain toxin
VIIPDVNLLLYAYDADSPFHARAAAWWRSCLSGSEPVGMPGVVAFGFVRVGTSARAFRSPMMVSEAAAHVRSWLQRPMVRILEPGPDHLGDVLRLLEALGAAGNLVTTARLPRWRSRRTASCTRRMPISRDSQDCGGSIPSPGAAGGRLRKRQEPGYRFRFSTASSPPSDLAGRLEQDPDRQRPHIFR